MPHARIARSTQPNLLADRDGAPSVAIVSEAAARQFWSGQDAVGKYLLLKAGPWKEAGGGEDAAVIGVAGDVKGLSLRDDAPRSFVYVPLQQEYRSRVTIVARTRTCPQAPFPLRQNEPLPSDQTT